MAELVNKKISKVFATGLLGSVDVEWGLRDGVNILSGHNGSGKSTLLRGVADRILTGRQPSSELIESIEVECNGGGELFGSDLLVLNRDLGGFSTLGAEVCEYSEAEYLRFCDILDRMLEPSGKVVVRSYRDGGLESMRFELTLRSGHKVEISYNYLSAGERLAVSMYRAILEHSSASVLVIDEPEISLSMEWQSGLIEGILELRPSMQLLIATHSPAIIMRGWVDCVAEMDDITNS